MRSLPAPPAMLALTTVPSRLKGGSKLVLLRLASVEFFSTTTVR